MNKLFFFFFAIAFSIKVYAQHPNVLISNGDTTSPSEPSIAIDPKNTNSLVVGTNYYYYWYSTNGGSTWSARGSTTSSYGNAGDPLILIDTLQYYYYVHLGYVTSAQPYDRVVCQRSVNKGSGASWGGGAYFGLNGNKFEDKEWGTVDRKTNRIYATWTQYDNATNPQSTDSSTIRISSSTNQGASWSAPTRVNKLAGDCLYLDMVESHPSTGPNSEVYVAWASPQGIKFQKSTNAGATWLSKDVFVDSLIGGLYYPIPEIKRSRSAAWSACDLSNGPHKGTIYISWADKRSGNIDIWLSKSTNGGTTWSPAVRVNDDNTNTDQFFPAMTIDQTNGNLYFVFYDRRNYTDDATTEVYMACSKDGGSSFFNFKVSATPFVVASTDFLGDYISVAAHNNVIRPVWVRVDNKNNSLWTALVNYTLLGVDPELKPSIPVALEQNYPNPFNDMTAISFSVFKNSSLSLEVFDIYGRSVAKPIDQKMYAPGTYSEYFNANTYHLAPGIYFYRISGGGEKSEYMKMILSE